MMARDMQSIGVMIPLCLLAAWLLSVSTNLSYVLLLYPYLMVLTLGSGVWNDVHSVG